MSTATEQQPIEARRASAAVRRSAMLLSRSVDRVIDQARAFADPKRRELLRRASNAILAAAAVREAAAKLPQTDGAIYLRLADAECASIMNSVVAWVKRLDVDHAFSALYDNPVALAVALDNWIRFSEPERKTGAPQSKPRATARAAFDAQRELVRPKVWTADLKVVRRKGLEDRPFLMGVASSDAVDLEGDQFDAKTALVQMRDGFKGKLAFLNHRYAIPEDVLGTIAETALVKRNGRTDLDVVIAVETANERAVTTYRMVKENKTRIGLSVGVLVTDAKPLKGGGSLITGVLPLELSGVGIPANQTAWTQGGQ